MEEDGHDESDSDDDEDGLWDEEEYQCPIDAVDPFVLFADVMNGGGPEGRGREDRGGAGDALLGFLFIFVYIIIQ